MTSASGSRETALVRVLRRILTCVDASLAFAARALERGEPLAALPLVALRDEPTALALRGIAMAQLGDLSRASRLLARASRRFTDAGDALGRAKVEIARIEVALARREVGDDGAELELTRSRRILERAGDRDNAVRAGLLLVRRSLLGGELARANRLLARVDLEGCRAATRVLGSLVAFDVAVRTGDGEAAAHALDRGERDAGLVDVPSLIAELAAARTRLGRPIACLEHAGAVREVALAPLVRALTGFPVVVDTRVRSASFGATRIPFAQRPVLLALFAALARRHPHDVPRESLVAEVFGARHRHPSLRVRLRVEVARLRRILVGRLGIEATASGYRLVAEDRARIAVVSTIRPDADAAIQGLLADGEAWSTAAIAKALGLGPRTVQRTVAALVGVGEVAVVGRGPDRRVVQRPIEPDATLRFEDVEGGRT